MVNLSKQHQDILQALISRANAGTLHGAFDGIPIEVYHDPACPGVSSTTIKRIAARSFKHAAKEVFVKTPPMQFGTAFHTYMQGAKDFAAQYSVGKMEPFSERNYLSWDDFSRIKLMSDNVIAHPIAGPLVEESEVEKTFFSICPLTGVLRKCRPDNWKGAIMTDYKTCADASRAGFARQARKLMYRISAAYYMDVANDALDTQGRFEEFKFIAVESEDLHEVAVYDATDNSLEVARGEIFGALTAIANSMKGGWTGYPLYSEPLSI